MKLLFVSFLGVAILLAPLVCVAQEPDEHASLIVVAGAAGEAEYENVFKQWAENWQKAAAAGGARVTVLGLAGKGSDLAAVREALEKDSATGPGPLWLVLLGHGTSDNKEPKFNLRGDDLSASELARLLKRFEREVVVIAAFSSSGAFLPPLSAPGRVIVTATRTGSELNFARFGQYISEAIVIPAADLDHDGQTSLLEAWLSGAQRVADFYKSDGRIATEHSLLDDNGDGRGTPPDWFQGIRLTKKSKDDTIPDGLRAHQLHLVPSAAERQLSPKMRADRDTLEIELAALRGRKATLPEEQYYAKLEAILRKIARLYREAATDKSQ